MTKKMELRRLYLRNRTKVIALLGFICLGVVYSVYNKLLYLENNLPFFARTMDVPYEADFRPSNPKIPKIIHQTWKSRSVPSKFAAWMHTWHEKHPDYEYWFWTDDDARRLIGRKYPDFLTLFDNYAYNIQRADVIRYFILYEYGGIYADLDVEMIKSMDSILKESCYLSQEPLEHAFFFWGMKRLACNAIMACRPKHPFFKKVLENLSYYKGMSIAPLVRVSMPVMESSGPKMVTYNLDLYEQHASEPVNAVHLWPAEYFFPDADQSCMPYVKEKCSNPGYRSTFSAELQKVCVYHERTAYANQPHANPYGNHHWSHTYYGLGKQENIRIQLVDKKVRLASEVLDAENSLWRKIKEKPTS